MLRIGKAKTKYLGNEPLAWIWTNSQVQRLSVFVLAIADVAIALCMVCEALALKDIINNAASGDAEAFAAAAWVMAGLVTLKIILPVLTRWLSERTKAELENRLKDRLFNALLTKDYPSVSAVHSEEWMNRLTSDTVIVADNAVDIVPNALAAFVKLAVSVLLVIYLVKEISWIVFPCAIAVIIVTVMLRGHMKKLHKRIQEADGKLRTFISDCLSSLMIIRSFSREESSVEIADKRMEEHAERRMDRIRFSNLVSTGYQFVLDGVYVAAVIYCGYSILTGTMNYGTFSAVVKLAGNIQGPITSMSGYVPRWYAMQASAERLMEAERFAEDYANGKRGREEVLEFYDNSFEGISIRNACFTYTETAEMGEEHQRGIVINGLNIDIDKHDVLAITGPSGCGKSTLLKILMSFYPLDSGDRLIRIKKLARTAHSEGNEVTDNVVPLDSSWRGLFAYVPQGNQLMSGSIRDVLTFSDRSVADEDIASALDIACASDFTSALPEGLETQLGERGAGLSEGQIQRIAIARAILSGQPVLLLDEATSSLDEATEAELIRKLSTLTDRTVIIVTHRLKVLSICNKVLTMERHDIKEGGSECVHFRTE